MLIRKNTKAFKTILEIVSTCQDRPDRDKLVRLYITKAGHSIDDRINVEGIQGESGLFYEMTYQTVLSNLQSSNHQLCVSDNIPGIYFFHSTSNKIWDEAPFEFDEEIKSEFSSLPELPAVRKKEKTAKFEITGPNQKSESSPAKKDKATASNTKADVGKAAKPVKLQAVPTGAKQPDFDLKHEIHFSNLDRIIFRDSKLDKRGLLEYYNEISDYLLPYLKDRLLWTKRDTDTLKPPIEMTVGTLFRNNEDELPRWIKTQLTGSRQKKNNLQCNDREHLLFYVENGSLQFDHELSKIKHHDTPDYLIIGIDSPEFDITKAIDVALAANEVLEGLQLRSCPKTDGVSGFHIYISLETTSTFDTSFKVAEYICKLIGLKIPDRVSLIGSESHGYGKVTLDYSMNAPDKAIVAPYSLVPGQSTIVATPLLWDEVSKDLRVEEFNHETIFKRLKHSGDPLENLKKRVNADDLLERLETHYSFLF
ncbi:hypothetical protein WBG78_04365 [Chryseolinea sp. T2]|uniref:non-homologous end-joining DNA ligase LigD n=1 Tax=Chryseolinea sp. T2 TaxID=3129255 RepID=UPI0030785DF7